eukprot:GHVO01055763.1.p1 GENE.GHVO01055763.1~~GHVO01055763.1.p1  ORF type:complete len:165 (+),score=16.25 GHVO01055763.1:259-753(+)
MASFDLVCKLDMGEMKNALNMAIKQITGRYDFKGSKISLEIKNNDSILEIKAEDDYKMKAALDILRSNMIKRNLGMKYLDCGDIEPSGNQMFKQSINLKSGIDSATAKSINKAIKDSGLKVKSSFMDEKVRVEGKKIDDLQAVMGMLKEHKDVKVELSMENMKR